MFFDFGLELIMCVNLIFIQESIHMFREILHCILTLIILVNKIAEPIECFLQEIIM